VSAAACTGLALFISADASDRRKSNTIKPPKSYGRLRSGPHTLLAQNLKTSGRRRPKSRAEAHFDWRSSRTARPGEQP
jgi:hypothetical protein